MNKALTELATTARRLERGVPKLDAVIDRLSAAKANALDKLNSAIERLTAERQAASELSAEIFQRVADERARAEQDENQAAEFVAGLEQIQEQQRAEAEQRRRKEAEAAGMDALARFLAEQLHEAPGYLISFAEFYRRFKEWLPKNERYDWSQIRVSRGLRPKFQTGRGTANKVYLINAAWQPCEVGSAYVVSSTGQIQCGGS
jgi:hypothetical protein